MATLNTFAIAIGVIHPLRIKIRDESIRFTYGVNIQCAHITLKQTNKPSREQEKNVQKIEEKMTASSCMDRVYGVYVVLGELVCLSNSVSRERRKQQRAK